MTDIETRIATLAGEERAAALGVTAQPAAAPPPTVAELMAESKAKAEAERDAKAVAAFIEYSNQTDPFAKARARARLGSDVVDRGYQLAHPAKKD